MASLAWKRLVTSWLYQPAAFGLVVACRSLSDGATVSILTVSDFCVWFVALSVAWQSIWWMPSLETLVVQLPETPATRVSAVEEIRPPVLAKFPGFRKNGHPRAVATAASATNPTTPSIRRLGSFTPSRCSMP